MLYLFAWLTLAGALIWMCLRVSRVAKFPRMARASSSPPCERQSALILPVHVHRSIKDPRPSFYYKFVDNRWRNSKKLQACKISTSLLSTLRVCQFNVLFDLYSEQERVVNSARRYEYQFSTLLPGLDADVLSLNEVTEHYLGRLLELDWVRSKYYVTRFSSKTSFSYNDKNKYFFVVLLSKYSFHAVYNFSFDRSIPSRPGSVVAGVLQLPHGRFLTICTAHLKAFPEFFRTRERQLQELFGFMDRLGKSLPGKNSSLIIGDMNMHHGEEAQLADHKARDFVIRDLWPELRPGNPGYTLDPTVNTMIPRMWDAKSSDRFRLDRGFLIHPQGSRPVITPVRADLFGQQSLLLCSTRTPQPQPVAWCTPAWRAASDSDSLADTFASDHFGLTFDFVVDPE